MDIEEKKEFVQNKVQWYESCWWVNPFLLTKVCPVPAGALKPLVHFTLFCFGCSQLNCLSSRPLCHPAPWNSVVFLCLGVEVSGVFVWLKMGQRTSVSQSVWEDFCSLGCKFIIYHWFLIDIWHNITRNWVAMNFWLPTDNSLCDTRFIMRCMACGESMMTSLKLSMNEIDLSPRDLMFTHLGSYPLSLCEHKSDQK